jgi:hypothetical protein
MASIPGPQAQNGNLSRADDVEGGSVIFELLLIRHFIISTLGTEESRGASKVVRPGQQPLIPNGYRL